MKLIVIGLVLGLVILGVAAAGPWKLSDFPRPFVENGVLGKNVLIIIGDESDNMDVVSAVGLIFYYQRILASNLKPRTPVQEETKVQKMTSYGGITRFASEVTDISNHTAVLMGGPCANAATAELLNYPDPCYESVESGKAQILLIEHPNGNVAIIVNGRTALDTRIAVSALTNELIKSVSGTKAEVTAKKVLNSTFTDIVVREVKD